MDDSGGPGVDYTTIQAAVDEVPEGAVILVRAGDYDGFLMTKALTVIGAGADTRLFGTIQVRDLPPSKAATLSAMGARFAELQDCQNTVVLDRLFIGSPSFGRLDVSNCEDVRGSGFTVRPGVFVESSRVQISSSQLGGLGVTGSSFAHLTSCVVVGEDGGACETTGCLFDGTEVEDGGDAIRVGPGAHLRIVHSFAAGGLAGFNLCGCSGFGLHGRSCVVEGSAEIWNTRVFPGGAPITVDLVGSGSFTDQTPLPSMNLSGTGAAGTFLGFEIEAPPGASARFILGRGPDRTLVPGSTIERLVLPGRVASLGEVPASGSFSLGFTQPGFPPGTIVWAQMSATFPDGRTELSNAVAFVIPE